MKRFIAMLLCICLLLLTGCAGDEIAAENNSQLSASDSQTADRNQSEQETDTVEKESAQEELAHKESAPEEPVPEESAPEQSLRDILVSYLGSDTIEEFCEADYDRDGTTEAFALADVNDGIGTVYYVNQSGVSPAIGQEALEPYGEGYNLIEFSDAAFYVIGQYSATSSPSYVLGVQNGAWYLSDISLQGGSLTQISGTNDLTYTQDAYDACIDGTGHTWKPYYLYWDGAFKEYGGIEITEEELLRCDGAGDIIKEIVPSGSHINHIFYRGNGIININISDDFNLSYATLQLSGTAVTLVSEGWDTDGAGVCSGVYFDALIPDIAVYPEEFPVEASADDSQDELLSWSDFCTILGDASVYAWNWYWDPSQYLSSTDTIPDTEGMTYNGVYAAVTVPGISSIEDLRAQSHQYFSYGAIEDMESHLLYKEENGKLYIGLMGGLGDTPVSEIYFDGYRLDNNTYRLDLSEGYSTGDSIQWSVYYIREDGDWVFDSPIQYSGINPLPIYEGGNGSFVQDLS